MEKWSNNPFRDKIINNKKNIFLNNLFFSYFQDFILFLNKASRRALFVLFFSIFSLQLSKKGRLRLAQQKENTLDFIFLLL